MKRLKEKPLPNIEQHDEGCSNHGTDADVMDDNRTDVEYANQNHNASTDSIETSFNSELLHDDSITELQHGDFNIENGSSLQLNEREESCLGDKSNDSIQSLAGPIVRNDSCSENDPYFPPIEEIFLSPAEGSSNSFASSAGQNQNGIAGNRKNSVCIDPIKTEPVMLLEPRLSNDSILDNLLQEESEEEDKYDDDLTFMVNKKKGYAQAMKCTTDGLIKRIDDEVSGDTPYTETVRIYFKKLSDIDFYKLYIDYLQKKGRIYMYGDKKFEVPYKVIKTFKDWNKNPLTRNAKYDKRMVHALLVMLDDSANNNGTTSKNAVKLFIIGMN